jgi:Predicted hydrolase (HAD superfamily)
MASWHPRADGSLLPTRIGEYLLASYRTLKPRPGIAECFSRLRAAGFTIWALTAGDTARVAGYLADGGLEFPSENFVSCDTIGIGKPAPESYKYLLDRFDKEGLEAWFAAAHMWDAAAARRSG